MSDKLDTAEKVLEWAASSGACESLLGHPIHGPDTETAAYLAECVRLRIAFDEFRQNDG